MVETNYTKKAVHGAGVIFVLGIFTSFVAYLTRLLLAKNLSVEQFGLFYSVLTLVLFIGLFRSIGLNSALGKFIPEFQVKKNQGLVKQVIISVVILKLFFAVILFLILIFSAKFLAVNYFHNPQAALILEILAIIILVYPFSRTVTFAFHGFKKMYHYSLSRLADAFFILLIAFVGLKFNKTAVIPALAYLFAPIIVFILFAPIFLTRVFPEFLKIKAKWIDKKLMSRLLRYGFPVVLVGAGHFILGYTDTIMLTYFSGLKQVGLYNIALPTARLLLNFGVALGTIILPFTSELWGLRQMDKLKQGIDLSIRYLMIVLLPAALIIFSFPKLLLGLFFGQEFVQSYPALKILSIGIVFLTMTSINGSVLSGIGKPKLYTHAVLTATLFNIIFNLILIPRYGFVGAAIATSCSYLILFILSFFKLKKFITVQIPVSPLLKTLFVSLVFLAVIHFLKSFLVLHVVLEAVIVVSIALLIYLLLLFVFRLLTVQEIKMLYNRIVKS